MFAGADEEPCSRCVSRRRDHQCVLAEVVGAVLPGVRRRVNQAERTGNWHCPPGMVLPQPDSSVRAANATVRDLVAFAFDVEPDQITGASGWQLTARFNIEGRPSAGAVASNGLSRERMQSLLRERFKLRTHTEAREMSFSALVLADRGGKLGPNLKPTTADCAASRVRKEQPYASNDAECRGSLRPHCCRP